MRREHDKYFRLPTEVGDNGNNPPVIPHDLGEDTGDDDYDDYDEDDSYDHEAGDDDEDEGVRAPIDGGHWDDNVAEVEGREQPPPLVPAIVGQQQGAPGLANGADIGDDIEGNVEDDMEGAMEAIGMRGPIYGVVQNVCDLAHLHRLLIDKCLCRLP